MTNETECRSGDPEQEEALQPAADAAAVSDGREQAAAPVEEEEEEPEEASAPAPEAQEETADPLPEAQEEAAESPAPAQQTQAAPVPEERIPWRQEMDKLRAAQQAAAAQPAPQPQQPGDAAPQSVAPPPAPMPVQQPTPMPAPQPIPVLVQQPAPVPAKQPVQMPAPVVPPPAPPAMPPQAQSVSPMPPMPRKKKKSAGGAMRALFAVVLVALAAVGGWLLRGAAMPAPPEPVETPVSASVESQPPAEPEVPVKDLTADEENGAIGILRLANTQHPLPDGYVPPELVTMDDAGRQLDARVAAPLNAMFQAAKADGVSLVLTSGYRSEERQKTLFVSMVQDYLSRGYSQADAYSATKRLRNIPGTSEHQTGLAADIVTPSYWDLDDGFADTAAAKWMVEHAAEYGFILRYPKDKDDITGTHFEPWHYRYVGVEDAKQIMQQKICLEEYLAKDR